MSKVIRAHIELVSEESIKAIISKDAQKMSTKPVVYTADNNLNYYVVVNSWLLCIKQWSEYGWMKVHDLMMREGLIPTIKRFNDAADKLVHGLEVDDILCESIHRDVQRSYSLRHVPVDWDKNIGFDAMATTLFLYRYPKRFSPLSNDKIQQASLSDFLAVENRTKLLQRSGYPQYIIERVREVIYSLPWDKIMDECEAISPQDIIITSGVGFDAKASLGSKLLAISQTNPEYFLSPFGIPWAGVIPTIDTISYGKTPHRYDVRTVTVRAVPKSYKASRIIAMEQTYRQAYAKRVFTIIDRYLPDAINLHDQTQNQRLAELGSINGDLATLDLSNASDCISKALFLELFPRDVSSLLASLTATHYEIDGKVRLLQQFSTAGNALTFVVESIVFWAIAKASCDTQSLLIDEDPGITSVYGDDIIVPSQYAEGVVDWLKALGFIINESKSFIGLDNLYRESCGCEYWRGTDVSSLFYPRFPIQGKLTNKGCVLGSLYLRDGFTETMSDSTSSLIDLQHKLYRVCMPASQLISELIKEAHPKMTTSMEGSIYGDIWDYDDIRQKRFRPASLIEVSKGRMKDIPKGGFVRNNLVTGYPETVVVTPLKVDGCTNDFKYRMSAKYVLKKELSDKQIRLLDLYNYSRFLKYGPKPFSDAHINVLELTTGEIREISISDITGAYDVSSISRNEAYGQLELNWGFKMIDN